MRPRFVPSRRSPTWRQAKGGSRGGLQGRERTAILLSDATILTETPPLRACWSKLGQQAEVSITGNRSKRVVYGALARRLGIEVRLLPTACPELNPLEGLWRLLKGRVLCNEPMPDLDVSLRRALDHLEAMRPNSG